REGTIMFPDESVLGPGEEITIAENSTSFYEDTLFTADYRFKSGSAVLMIVQGVFKLKNGGDELLLKNKAGKVIDVFSYGTSDYTGTGWSSGSAEVLSEGQIAKRAPLGNGYSDTNSSEDWKSTRLWGIGQSSFQVKTFSGSMEVTAFTSPDSSYEVVVDAIDGAKSVIHLSLYQFTNWHVAQHLFDALDRGVEVNVLLEGGPVGGIGNDERYIMKAVADKGGQIRLMLHDPSDDIHERYRYLHEKYAVIDGETSIVMSENWGANGLSKNTSFGNRGWGISVRNKALTDELLEVFEEDWNSQRRDIVPYSFENYSVSPGYSPDTFELVGSYESKFEPLSVDGHFSITPVLSPDTSLDEGTVIGMIRSAQSSVFVEQFYIVPDWGDSRTNPYLEEAVDAARRGVEVRIILDDSEYNVEPDDFDNDDVVEALNELALIEGLDMMAKLFNSSSHGILKVHNKGVVVDGSKVLVSSINWNKNSITRNREVGLIVENEEVGKYFKNVFLQDWKDDVRNPIARGCWDRRVSVGEAIEFDGSASYDAAPLEYRWDFDGDGRTDSNESVSAFTYEAPGLYRVELNVSDPSGNHNTTSCVVEVVADSSGNGAGQSGALVWSFYIILAATAVIIVLYARRLSKRLGGNGKNKKKVFKRR
ncbi:MAG: PKD domain-containing protein, partial [Thermoplasmata archaeon]|nr:PKD domain-containing protein [Thermoplasmata archaeon]